MNTKKVPTLGDIDTSAKGIDNADYSKNEELIKRKDLKDTPFTVISTPEGSFGSMGKWRLTEVFKTEKEAEKDVSGMTWNRILQVTSLVSSELVKEQLNKK